MGRETTSHEQSPDRRDLLQGRGVAFLVSQVGAHSSRSWAARLRPLGLDSRLIMLLWHVALAEGRSQRELADALGLPESRIVGLVRVLERERLIERRADPRDRRVRRLHLTDGGRDEVDQMTSIAVAHESAIAEGLSARDRRRLIDLLERIARNQGLIRRVHPDF